MSKFAISCGQQIKAARALLGWRRVDLADAAGLCRNAVAYWEARPQIPPPLPSGRVPDTEPVGCGMIRKALEDAGVVMFSDPAPGVRLRGSLAIGSQNQFGT